MHKNWRVPSFLLDADHLVDDLQNAVCAGTVAIRSPASDVKLEQVVELPCLQRKCDWTKSSNIDKP